MKINDLTQKSQSLTEEASSALNDLKNKTTHPAPCCCNSCLYFEYRKGPKGRGKPVKEFMFFLAWLIHRVKMEHLEISGKAKPILVNEKKTLQLEFGKDYYKKAPYLKRTYEILEKIDDRFLDLYYSVICLYKLRIEKLNFLELEEQLIKRRNLEWLKSQPIERKIWERNWDDLKLAKRAANFIHSMPSKKITQRDLQRALSSRKKRIKIEDLKRIQDILKVNYRIEVKPVKRSIIYQVLK